MSIVHVNQIKNYLNEQFDGKIDLSDVSGANAEMKENFFLTRALTAYAITIIGEADIQQASLAITDGSEDNGIDAIYYNTKNSTVYIVQSKWIHNGNSEPESGDINKFIRGVLNLVNLKFDNFNEKIKSRSEELKKIMFDASTKFELILVHTGINFSIHSQRIIKEFLDEINDASEVCSFTLLNQTKLHESLLKHMQGEPIKLNLNLKEWGKVANPQEAYYGQISALEISMWWKEYGKKLFTKNIRELLGNTEINEDIKTTLDTDPLKFWYYNNGITMICDKVTKSIAGGSDNAFGQFECENISIVNGAQTVGTIGKYGLEKGDESLNNITVQIRVISLENSDGEFGENITKNNNRQNRIENRDFISMDPNQIRIKNELAIDGINYSIVRSEDNVNSENAFDLHESTTSLACSSGNVGIVVQLKREIGKLWEDINKSPYISLFNGGTTSTLVWNYVQLQRYFDTRINLVRDAKEGREANILVHGNRIISMMVFESIEKDSLRTTKLNLEEFIKQQSVDEKIKKYCDSLISEVNNNFNTAVIPTLFKNLGKCNEIVTKINQSLIAESIK